MEGCLPSAHGLVRFKGHSGTNIHRHHRHTHARMFTPPAGKAQASACISHCPSWFCGVIGTAASWKARFMDGWRRIRIWSRMSWLGGFRFGCRSGSRESRCCGVRGGLEGVRKASKMRAAHRKAAASALRGGLDPAIHPLQPQPQPQPHSRV